MNGRVSTNFDHVTKVTNTSNLILHKITSTDLDECLKGRLEKRETGIRNPESGIGTGIGTGTGTGTGTGEGTGMGRKTYIKTGTTFTLI